VLGLFGIISEVNQKGKTKKFNSDNEILIIVNKINGLRR